MAAKEISVDQKIYTEILIVYKNPNYSMPGLLTISFAPLSLFLL
jgi:hypothetical protein